MIYNINEYEDDARLKKQICDLLSGASTSKFSIAVHSIEHFADLLGTLSVKQDNIRKYHPKIAECEHFLSMIHYDHVNLLDLLTWYNANFDIQIFSMISSDNHNAAVLIDQLKPLNFHEQTNQIMNNSIDVRSYLLNREFRSKDPD